jgi:ribosomal protein S27AE
MNSEIMEKAGFGMAITQVKNEICPTCGKEIKFNEFKDRLSVKEYGISGMCQKCQDEIFGE